MFKTSLALLLGAAVVSARHCQDVSVPVKVESRNGVFNIKAPSNDIEITDFLLSVAQSGANYTADLLDGYATVSGNYKLAATYCEPDSGPGKKGLQILTHGVGFSRSYWDLPNNNHNYSYAALANDDGYSTLTWDRLGIAKSSKGDAVNEIQSWLEIAALKELTNRAAKGKLCCTNHKYEKIFLVGHSFGSIISYTLTQMYPDIATGIALTGFSQVPNFLGQFLLGGNFIPTKEIPTLALKYPKGYYAPSSAVGVQINFFAPHNFDPAMLNHATKTGQPFSLGEILTLGAGTGSPSSFAGPALVITGDRDVPFCGGSCTTTSVIDDSAPNLLEVSKQFLSKATPFQATVVPNSGHGLNMEYSHPFTYKTILDFFNAHA